MGNTFLCSVEKMAGSEPTSCLCLLARFCLPLLHSPGILYRDRIWQRWQASGLSLLPTWCPARRLTFTRLLARRYSEMCIGFRYRESRINDRGGMRAGLH